MEKAERESVTPRDAPRTFTEAFARAVAQWPDEIALTGVDGTRWTWVEYARQVQTAAARLYGLGVRPGHAVAILLDNRPEFFAFDMAVLHLRATPFSIYPTEPLVGIAARIDDAGASVVITERSYLPSVDRAVKSLAVRVVVIDDEGSGPPVTTRSGSRLVEAVASGVRPEDVATLIYTSGTTGTSKAVPLTHANLMASARSFAVVLQLPSGAPTLSYSPMAHVAERMCSLYLGTLLGLSVTCCPSDQSWTDALAQSKPAWLSGAPRTWEKLHAALQESVDRLPRERQEELAAGVVALDRQLRVGQRPGGVSAGLRSALSDLLENVGLGSMRVAVCGAAAIDPTLVAYFHAVGVPLLPIWGLSETSGPATANRVGEVRSGTVGRPVDGAEVRISRFGEIEVRGPAVMAGHLGVGTFGLGYDDWFPTGDLGSIDDDGFLSISGRVKDLIISSSGKNMSPVRIEQALVGANPVFRHAVVVGDGRPYNVALISIDPHAVAAVARHGSALPWGGAHDQSTLRRLLSTSQVIDVCVQALDRANAQLSRPEQLKRCFLVADAWDENTAFVTPTLKLRRAHISAAYEEAITMLYEASSDVRVLA